MKDFKCRMEFSTARRSTEGKKKSSKSTISENAIGDSEATKQANKFITVSAMATIDSEWSKQEKKSVASSTSVTDDSNFNQQLDKFKSTNFPRSVKRKNEPKMDEVSSKKSKHEESTNPESSGERPTGIIERVEVLPRGSHAESERNVDFQVRMAKIFKHLCQGKFPKTSDTVSALCVPGIVDLIRSKDPNVYGPAVRALFHISKHSCAEIEKVLMEDFVCRLVELLDDNDSAVKSNALSTITNTIENGNTISINYFLKTGFLSCLSGFLLSGDTINCKKALWALWNISNGTLEQRCIVVDAEIVPLLFDIVKSQKDQYETACWILENLLIQSAVNYNVKQRNHIAVYVCQKGGVMNTLLDFFGVSEDYSSEIVESMLDNLENIFKVFCEVGDDDIAKSKKKWLSRITKLQHHDNNIVRARVAKIVSGFHKNKYTV